MSVSNRRCRQQEGEPSPATGASQPRKRRNVGLAATLTLSMGAGPLVLFALSALSPAIIADLDLTRTAFGTLATTAFLIAAAVSGLLGAATDRLRSRAVMVAIFTGGALALVVAAQAESYLWLLCAVAISGVAQSLSNPVTNRLIAVHVPAPQRGILMGLKQSGVQLSQLFAGLLLPSVALLATWRGAMWAGVAAALLGLLLVARCIPTEGPAVSSTVREETTGRQPLSGSVWWLTGFALFSGAAVQSTNVYLPLFAHQDVGIGPTLAGFTVAVSGAVGMVARILWGRQVKPSGRPHLALTLLASTSGLSILLLVAAGATSTSALLWLGVAGHSASGLAANVVLMVVLLGAVRAERMGAASGVLVIGLYLGFASGPVAMGALLDLTDSYTVGWLIPLGAYISALILTFLWWLATRRLHWGAEHE